jgi:hypothetical protein
MKFHHEHEQERESPRHIRTLHGRIRFLHVLVCLCLGSSVGVADGLPATVGGHMRPGYRGRRGRRGHYRFKNTGAAHPFSLVTTTCHGRREEKVYCVLSPTDGRKQTKRLLMNAHLDSPRYEWLTSMKVATPASKTRPRPPTASRVEGGSEAIRDLRRFP